MIHSRRSFEGYLKIDHRGSPGVPADIARQTGMPGALTGLFEAPTLTCHHCGTVMLENPLRNRPRNYCSSCDHFLCDGCAAARHQETGPCRSMDRRIDAALKGLRHV